MVFFFLTILLTCCKFLALISFTFFQHYHSILAGGSKPSQSSNRAENCATSPCLLAIPAFDRLAGFYNRYLNSRRAICLR